MCFLTATQATGPYRVFELRSCRRTRAPVKFASFLTQAQPRQQCQVCWKCFNASLSEQFVICQPNDPTSQPLVRTFCLTTLRFAGNEVARLLHVPRPPGCGSAAFRLSIELGSLDYLRNRGQRARQPVARGIHLRTAALTAAPATMPATPANRTLPAPYVRFVGSVAARFDGELVSAQ